MVSTPSGIQSVVLRFVRVTTVVVPMVLVKVEARHVADGVWPMSAEGRMNEVSRDRAPQLILEALREFIRRLSR